MKRRDFLKYGVVAGTAVAGGAWPGTQPQRRLANDVVTLGRTGIKASRLAIGTGTMGYGRSSNQTRKLGIDGLADLLWYGFDEGVRFWDSADQYGSHPHLKKTLSKVPRDKVVILTKTHANTAADMKADIDRFRQEIGTDYIDIILLHAVTNANWPERRKGAIEALNQAREKGIVRAHGLSCHSIDALRAAARDPFVQVQLARFNPIGAHMDADPPTVAGVLRQMRAAGKAVVGMKILAEGGMRNRVDEALAHALGHPDCLDCFTIGVESRQELGDLIKRIPLVSSRA